MKKVIKMVKIKCFKCPGGGRGAWGTRCYDNKKYCCERKKNHSYIIFLCVCESHRTKSLQRVRLTCSVWWRLGARLSSSRPGRDQLRPKPDLKMSRARWSLTRTLTTAATRSSPIRIWPIWKVKRWFTLVFLIHHHLWINLWSFFLAQSFDFSNWVWKNRLYNPELLICLIREHLRNNDFYAE
jgi:hypothetical protein